MSFTTVSIVLVIAVAHFPLLVCATSLVDRYVREEEGPFRVFSRLRMAAGVSVPELQYEIEIEGELITSYAAAIAAGIQPDDLDIVYGSDGSFWADVLSCYKCFAPYAATLALITAVFPPLFYVLAAAGASVMLHEYRSKGAVMLAVEQGDYHDL